jgi:DNA-binding transcriptional ArsR family regulator
MLKYESGSLDDAFRALGDPTRRTIVERLSGGGASVSDLATRLPMSLPAVHQHLQVLAACGLIHWEKLGRVRWCRLEARRLREMENWFLSRRLLWERRLDKLGEHLEGKEKADDSKKRGARHRRSRPDLRRSRRTSL